MSKNYFPDYEIECNCGCGAKNISTSFLNRLNKARVLAVIPFPINSGCRCKIHNKAEGGSDTSSHLATDIKDCEAVDISITSSRARFKTIQALLSAGFTRIGIAKSFIHVDDDKSKAPSVSWVY